jgi:nucleoside-diphosphate-sugar epimerase
VVLHPGHISGPGWPVISPAGNLDPAAWTALATGLPLALPDHGLGVLHHVHADDVAQAFELALSRPAAIGGSFHVAAEQAMTQRGLVAGAARWFGREPALDFVSWDEFTRRAGAGHAEVTREHTSRSITASNGQADIGGQPFPGREPAVSRGLPAPPITGYRLAARYFPAASAAGLSRAAGAATN